MALAIKANRLGNSDSSRRSRYLSNANSSNSLDLDKLDKLGTGLIISIAGVGLSLFNKIARLVSRCGSNKELNIS